MHGDCSDEMESGRAMLSVEVKPADPEETLRLRASPMLYTMTD